MSGGAFNYKQYELGYIADHIEQIIYDYDNDKMNSWDRPVRDTYTKPEIDTFRQAVYFIRKAQIYAHRIDWLISGDDGTDSFFSRLENDLKDLDNSRQEQENT